MPPQRPNIIPALLVLLWFTWVARPAESLLDTIFISASAADHVLEPDLEQPMRNTNSVLNSPTILGVELIDGKVECRVNSQNSFKYSLQYKTDVEAVDWKSLPAVDGTGEVIRLIDDAPGDTRFYRVEVR